MCMKDREFWNEEMETLSPQKLHMLQKERLQNTIEWAYCQRSF